MCLLESSGVHGWGPHVGTGSVKDGNCVYRHITVGLACDSISNFPRGTYVPKCAVTKMTVCVGELGIT